jgi:hypothetical protein
MDQGQIVESGDHEQLLAKGGLYAQSWSAQIEGNSALLEELVQPVPVAVSPAAEVEFSRDNGHQ